MPYLQRPSRQSNELFNLGVNALPTTANEFEGRRDGSGRGSQSSHKYTNKDEHDNEKQKLADIFGTKSETEKPLPEPPPPERPSIDLFKAIFATDAAIESSSSESEPEIQVEPANLPTTTNIIEDTAPIQPNKTDSPILFIPPTGDKVETDILFAYGPPLPPAESVGE